MSLNLYLQLFFLVLVGGNLLLLKMPEESRGLYDRRMFWGASFLLITFVSFRPMGVGMDDLGYTGWIWENSCPTLKCGRWIQGDRDQVWYSTVGLLRSFYPYPQVTLWLAGLGLAVKLWVINRLCLYPSLALLFYVGCFFVIHDITALRVSLAISFYLLGFYCLVGNRFRWGAGLLAINGFFHLQAFVAPLLLAGRWFPLTSRQARFAFLFPLMFLMMAIYPGDGVLHFLMSSRWGNRVVNLLFHGYENYKITGVYDHSRLWPIVAPPTLFLAAWLIDDLFDRHRDVFKYVSTSLILAALFLWGYAVVPEVQLRFWHFFLVPIVFVIGNAKLNLWKWTAIVIMATLYLLKYTAIHDLLIDQRQVRWEPSFGGQISLAPYSLAVPCGAHCGFNVPAGYALTLEATANDGYQLERWSGGCEGTTPTCTLKVVDDISVAAEFVKAVGAD